MMLSYASSTLSQPLRSHEGTVTPLLRVKDLTLGFPMPAFRHGVGLVVQHLSFEVFPGEWVALVGESGCGKSMTLQAILNLLPPRGLITQGEVWFMAQNLLTLPEKDLRKIRGGKLALIPQDPLTALNPVYTLGNQMTEVIQVHKGVSQAMAKKLALELLDLVQIPDAPRRFHAYPHELSGGMRQRGMIAMALSCQPKLLLADEPTTALDVTVQAQIMALLEQVRREMNTAILMITHDLGVVAESADRIGVMYAGELVEYGTRSQVLDTPEHPYTQALLQAIPDGLSHDAGTLMTIEGVPPGIRDPLTLGCAFAPRCMRVAPHCREHTPVLQEVGFGHKALCWYPASKLGQTNASE
ncbi:MAG: ABC transporter ATP-binding protein [Vampirovibrionales bacterium]